MMPLRDGFYTALGTPLSAEGAPLEESFRRQIDMQVEAGAAGMLVMGSMGAEPGIRERDYARVAAVAAEATRGRAALFVGAMDNSIWRVCDRVDALRGLAIDGVVVTAPYYETYPDDVLEKFFEGIADISPFPVYLYDLAVLTKHKITFEMASALSRHSNIAGIKTGDAVLARRLLREVSSIKVLFSGMDVFDVARAYGYPRVLDGMFACVPKTAKAFSEAFLAGDPPALGAALDKILALRDLIAENGVWPGFTAAMNMIGLEGIYGYGFDCRPREGEVERVRRKMIEIGEVMD